MNLGETPTFSHDTSIHVCPWGSLQARLHPSWKLCPHEGRGLPLALAPLSLVWTQHSPSRSTRKPTVLDSCLGSI